MNVKAETYAHIGKVRHFIGKIVRQLLYAAEEHDESKLLPPEVAMFEEYTPKLSASTYGSEGYDNLLKGLRPALEHH